MKRFFIIIRNIFIGIFLVIYFSFIILISTLLLNRNDYGVTEFGDKALILVDEEISNENYKEGTLVIIERKELTELTKGQEVFVYQPDKKDNSVDIVIANIAEIFPEDDSPYLTLSNNGSAWGEEYIGGVAYSTYDDIGGFLKFIESKWIFFILLIIPCFFILLYEIYLLIIAIKFDDYEDDEEEEVKEVIEEKAEIKEEKEEANEDKLSYIEKQIMELKANSNPEMSEVVEDKNEKIDDLMQQISALRKEYDEQNTFTQEIPVINENEALINELNDFVDSNETIIKKVEEETKENVVEKQKIINKNVNNNNPKQQNNNKNNNKNNNNQRNNNHKNNNNQRNNNRNHNKNNYNNKNRNNNKQKNNKK